MNIQSTFKQTFSVAVALALVLCAGNAGAWTVKAYPAVAPPTGKVMIKGSQFPPNGGVDVFLLKEKLCSRTTDAQGQFSCAVKVPWSVKPGDQTIKALHRPSGQWVKTPFTVRTDWGNEAFDGGRTRYNPYENLINASNVSRLKRLWTKPGTLQLVAGGRVFIRPATFSGIQALSETTGAEIWRRQDVDRALAAAEGMVYVNLPDDAWNFGQRLTGLSAHDGKVLWVVSGEPNDAFPSASSAVVDTMHPARLFVFSTRSRDLDPHGDLVRLSALDALTGRVRWSADAWSVLSEDTGSDERGREFDSNGEAGPIANGRIFVHKWFVQHDWSCDIYPNYFCVDEYSGDEANTVVSKTNGELLWSVECSFSVGQNPEDVCPTHHYPSWAEPSSRNPVVAGEGLLIYQVYNSDGVIANATDGVGVATWSRDGYPPALAKGVIYYVGGCMESESDGEYYNLAATRARDGTLLWSRKVFANPCWVPKFQPTVANGVIYYGNKAFDTRNGAMMWSNPSIVDNVSPIVVNGRLYANTTDGQVSAWGLK